MPLVMVHSRALYQLLTHSLAHSLTHRLTHSPPHRACCMRQATPLDSSKALSLSLLLLLHRAE